MGFDKTPPANRRIFVFGIVTLVSLVALVPIFRSYFFAVMEPHQARLVDGVDRSQLQTYRDEQARSLVSVDQAIARLGQGGRAGSIAPRQGDRDSIAAVGGWTELPNEAAQAAAEHAYDVAAARREAAEAALAADGGVPVDAAVDAAAPEAPVPQDR